MNILIQVQLDTPTFPTTEPQEAQAYIDQHGGSIYTWKTLGDQNWLEKGFARSDTLAFVVIPESLPDTIQMPPDHPAHNPLMEDL